MPSGGNESSAAASGMKKGPWSPAEDAILVEYVRKHGEGNWNAVQKNSGLSRCGKSCRLRWANHLRPNLKKGVFAPEEELLILRLHAQLGNKWARMAAHLPGRTDNEIKNYWNTRMKRRQRAGLPMYPPEIQRQAALHQHRPSSAITPPPTPPANAAMHFSASPIPLLDPIGFPTPALLSLRHHPLASPPPDPHRIKRLRDESLGLQLSFSAHPHPNPPPPHHHRTLFQLQQPQTIQNNLASFDLDPVLLPSFSVKTELPSNQLLPEPTGSGCGGLLDALLQEAESGGELQRDGLLPEAPAGDQDMKWVQLGGGGRNGGAPPHREAVESADKCDNSNHSAENKSAVGTKSSGEGMSVLLDTIPAAAALVPEWTNCENGGMSSGPSSVITADDIGLEMQHLASSLSVGARGARLEPWIMRLE